MSLLKVDVCIYDAEYSCFDSLFKLKYYRYLASDKLDAELVYFASQFKKSLCIYEAEYIPALIAVIQMKVQSNLAIRNFLVALKLFLNAKSSLSLSKWQEMVP